MTAGRTRILFVCVGNTCRSIMAEALCRRLAGDRVEAFSAGLSPLGVVVPETLDVLERLGCPTEDLASKGLDAVPLVDLDAVVSLIGKPGLRWIPRTAGGRRIAWDIPDPYGEGAETYLRTARRIERLVSELLTSLA